MKCIITSAMIALVAIASQAATLKWAANNIKDADSKAISGGVAYLVATGGTGAGAGYTTYTVESLKEAITGNKFTGSDAIATGKTGSSGQLSVAGIGSFGAGDSVSAIFVVFDGATIADSKNFMISGGPLTASWTSATGEQNLSFGNMSTGANKSASGWSAVPEPCSGALIALGLAAVALKRKVA